MALKAIDSELNEKVDMDFLLNAPLTELMSCADKVRRQEAGAGIELCNILNAKSGRCSEDCKFCAQSARHTSDAATYPLKGKTEIIAAAHQAREMGAANFGIVTSGNRLDDRELAVIAEAVAEIKSTIDVTVCASLGALKKEQFAQLRNAGLMRYHHNLETSERFYPQIVSTHAYAERVATVRAAQAVGLEVCSGGIIGMGETWADRIDMALALKELQVDSVPINLLVPVKGTQLEAVQPISCVDAVRTICIFRIVLKHTPIKIAGGRESILKDFQALGFMAGANGMLIGGYLTLAGRDVMEDKQLIKELEAEFGKESDNE